MEMERPPSRSRGGQSCKTVRDGVWEAKPTPRDYQNRTYPRNPIQRAGILAEQRVYCMTGGLRRNQYGAVSRLLWCGCCMTPSP